MANPEANVYSSAAMLRRAHPSFVISGALRGKEVLGSSYAALCPHRHRRSTRQVAADGGRGSRPGKQQPGPFPVPIPHPLTGAEFQERFRDRVRFMFANAAEREVTPADRPQAGSGANQQRGE